MRTNRIQLKNAAVEDRTLFCYVQYTEAFTEGHVGSLKFQARIPCFLGVIVCSRIFGGILRSQTSSWV